MPPMRASSTTAVSASAMPGPPLQRRVVLVGDRPHHGADVEGLLAVGVGLRREDVADGREVAARERVRVGRDVAVVRVARRRRRGAVLAGRHPGVLVVRDQDAVGAPTRSWAQYCAWPLGPMTRS